MDDPILGLYRQNQPALFKEWYWVTDGNGRQFATGSPDGLLGSIPSDEYTAKGGSYAGGTQSANTFNADRFASPVLPALSFFRNRVYDQNTGKWSQEDPTGVAGGLNLYSFNGNNPIMFTDPFGLCGRERGNCLQGEDSWKPDPRDKFQSITAPTGGGGVGLAISPALAPVGRVADAVLPDAGAVIAGPVEASFANDKVTLSGSPSLGALAAGVEWNIGDASSGTFSGAVGGLFGQGIMGGLQVNSNGSATVGVYFGYNIPGGSGNLFGRLAQFFSGSVSQTYH